MHNVSIKRCLSKGQKSKEQNRIQETKRNKKWKKKKEKNTRKDSAITAGRSGQVKPKLWPYRENAIPRQQAAAQMSPTFEFLSDSFSTKGLLLLLLTLRRSGLHKKWAKRKRIGSRALCFCARGCYALYGGRATPARVRMHPF